MANASIEKAKGALIQLKQLINAPKDYTVQYRKGHAYESAPIKGDRKCGYVLGSYLDDLGSVDFSQHTLCKYNPQVLILGRMNRRHMMEYGSAHDMKEFVKEIKAKELMATFVKDIYPFIEGEFLIEKTEDKEYYYYKKDYRNHRIIMNSDMSNAVWSLYEPKCNLIFGGPDPLQYLEFLTHQLPLDELKYMFYDVISEYIKIASEHNIEPQSDTYGVLDNVRNHTKSKHYLKLYSKSCEYTSAVTRFAQSTIDLNSFTIMDNQLAKLLISTYNTDSRQDFLNVIPPSHQIDESKIPEFAEKHAILSYIVDDYLVRNINSNPFQLLYCGQLMNKGIEQLIVQKKEKYQKAIDQVTTFEINRISRTKTCGRAMHISYSATLNKFQKQAENIHLNQIQYCVNPAKEYDKQDQIRAKVKKQILYNIFRREQLGMLQVKQRSVLKAFNIGVATRQEGRMFLEMMAEAYIQIGIPLPHYLETFVTNISTNYRNEYQMITKSEQKDINCLSLTQNQKEILFPLQKDVFYSSQLIENAAKEIEKLPYNEAKKKYKDLFERYPNLFTEENAKQLTKLFSSTSEIQTIDPKTWLQKEDMNEKVEWDTEIQHIIDNKPNFYDELQIIVAKINKATETEALLNDNNLTGETTSHVYNEYTKTIERYKKAAKYSKQNNIDIEDCYSTDAFQQCIRKTEYKDAFLQEDDLD